MNILAINQPYLSQPGFREVFEAAGHRTFSIGWYKEGCDLVANTHILTLPQLFDLLPADFIPHRIVYFDHSEPVRVIGLEDSPVPTIVHLVDTHLHRTWHGLWAGAFDAALIAMKGYMHLFREGPYIPPTAWLPLWAFSMGPSPESPRDVPVSFRGTIGGTHPKRVDFFTGVHARTPVDFGSGPFQDLYARSKIILNDCINDDLNWRVFEALASGALLLTPRVSPETLELFPEGEALVTYEAHNVDEAVSKIEYYLTHDDERLRIARNGYERLIKNHTAEHRARQLLSVIESVRPRPEARKRFCAAATYLKVPMLYPNLFPNIYTQSANNVIARVIAETGISDEEKRQQLLALRELAREHPTIQPGFQAHETPLK